MAMNMRRAAGLGLRVVRSPTTRRVVNVAEKVASVGAVLGVPGAGAAEKGLDVAGKILSKLS